MLKERRIKIGMTKWYKRVLRECIKDYFLKKNTKLKNLRYG